MMTLLTWSPGGAAGETGRATAEPCRFFVQAKIIRPTTVIRTVAVRSNLCMGDHQWILRSHV